MNSDYNLLIEILVGQMILLVDGDEDQYITFRSIGSPPIRLEQGSVDLHAVDELAVCDGWSGGRSAEQEIGQIGDTRRRRLKR